MYGVDTPEKSSRAQCPREEKEGELATKFTESLILNSKIRIVVIKQWDKFGGRVDGDLILDGMSLRESLLEKGYARPYYGEKKQSWCK